MKLIKKKIINITKEKKIPLIGHIAFGLIDRGTNLIQVRPTSLCPLSCIFCATDSGPFSRHRISEYVVELNYLLEWFNKVAEYKGEDIEAHIDTVGDPLTYKKLPELVKALRNHPKVKVISIQTHGALLTPQIIDKLEEAGLSRINLSIDSLNPDLARKISGSPWFDVRKVIEMARYIVENTRIDLLIAPVWIPGVNDKEIPRIIEFALKIGAGKRWPPLGIQKYEAHKRGRKPSKVKPMSWKVFYSQLRKWELKYGVKLILKPEDFNIHKDKRIPISFKIGEITIVKIVEQGWLRGEWLGVAKDRVVTVVGVPSKKPLINHEVFVKIIHNKDGIYLARVKY